MLLDLNSWWIGLEMIDKVYWAIALPSTLIFLIIVVMTFIGGDADDSFGDADSAIDADGGIGFQFITLKNLVGFFAIFSWTGLASLNSGFSMSTTLMISILSGIAMMAIMATIFYLMSKLTDDGTLRIDNAIGKLGEVYMNIPGESSGFGKVHINIQGAMREMEAMTKESEMIKTGTIIKVNKIIDGHILLVSPTSEKK
jgi:membrane protein implicated in regulation of membrane protease activity